MPLGTRAVIAIAGGTVLTVGTYLHATDREAAGLAAFAVGFFLACGWAFLGMELAQRGVDPTPPRTYLSGGMAALTLALYFGLRTHETLFER